MFNKTNERMIFILAPMDGITDRVFRQIIKTCYPPDLFFTEFTNVDGLNSSAEEIIKDRLIHQENESNLVAQLWGLKPENFYKTAKNISNQRYGKFVGIDLNMGCPDKTVTKNGACSALINNRELAKEIIKQTKKGMNKDLSISVKTRLGYNQVDLSWIEFLLSQKIDYLTIHARTKKEMSKVPAHYQYFADIIKLRDKIYKKTKIIANGDILNYKQGINLIKKYKLDGVMIGRGILQDPFGFSPNSPWESYATNQKIKLFQKHINLFEKYWKDKKPIVLLNKFCKVYINNFDGAKDIRLNLMKSNTSTELKSNLKKILLA